MRNIRVTLLVAALCCEASGQTAPGQAPHVEGVVVDSLTGAPLPRVRVTLKDLAAAVTEQYGAQSTEEGKFSVDGVKPGSYSVVGQRVGYVMPRVKVTVKVDDKPSSVQLQLVPVGGISGRITDSDGEPVEHASVTAEGLTRRESTTDEKGHFRLGGLAPGKYRIKASHASQFYRLYFILPEIRSDGRREVYNATTYYPSALSSKHAGLVEVKPGGESQGVDIQLVGVPFVRVSGRAIGMPRGAPEAYVNLSSHDIGGAGNPMHADGSFELWGFDPGKYWLSASWGAPGGVETIRGPRVSTSEIEIEVAGSNVDNIELRVIPDSNIEGRLEIDGQPGTQPTTEKMVTLRAAGGRPSMGPVGVAVGEDGSFRLEKISAGKYIVGLSWDSAYVKAVRMGGTTTDGAVLDLSNGSGGADLALLLGTETGSVSGTVRDDQGKAMEARVFLAEDDDDPIPLSRGAVAKQDGTYSFENVAPGKYRLVAAPEEDLELIRVLGFVGYEDLMERIDVRAGDKAAVDLRLRAERK